MSSASIIKLSPSQAAPLDVDQIRVVLGWRNTGKVKARGWGALKQLGRTPGVDLDAAALLCNASGQVISACSVDDDDPFRGAIVHKGDDKGKGKEAAEEIEMTLSRLPHHVQAVVLTLTSFTGRGFNEVNQTSFELYAGSDLRVQTFVPIDNPSANAALMVVIRRSSANSDQWEIKELSKLVFVDPHFGGNRDGAVNWKDLGVQHAAQFGVSR